MIIRRSKALHLIMLVLALGCADKQQPIQIIFDTDFGGDADDLGALAMLHHFHNKKEIKLLGVMCWNVEKFAVGGIDAVNTYYGNPGIPIGTRKAPGHVTPWNHSKAISDKLPHDLEQENAPDATILYRQLLSQSADQSVTLVTVGPLMNIKKLIDSPPDDHSDMYGSDLLHSKVKEVIIMGGNFPKSEYEWNFSGDMPGVTKYVIDKLKLPITFIGAEIGSVIRTGEVFNELPHDSPLYLGFYHFSKHAPWMNHQFEGAIYDNATFDQTAVLYAVRGGLNKYWTRVSQGRCEADDNGGNIWVDDTDSNHSYLELKMPIHEIEMELEAFMLGEF